MNWHEQWKLIEQVTAVGSECANACCADALECPCKFAAGALHLKPFKTIILQFVIWLAIQAFVYLFLASLFFFLLSHTVDVVAAFYMYG